MAKVLSFHWCVEEVAKAIHSIMATDILYPQRVITYRVTKFTSNQAQAAILVKYILCGWAPSQLHLNLGEQAHRSLWHINRAIRKDGWFTCIQTALVEAAYCFNSSVHRSNGLASSTLHTGQLSFSSNCSVLMTPLLQTTTGSWKSLLPTSSWPKAWLTSTALKPNGGGNSIAVEYFYSDWSPLLSCDVKMTRTP